ncbi:MAG TPA: ParA family protein [Anaerolineaceae bacterium]
MAYIIAVANEKGGVAKTTTTLSAGAALAEAGMRVLAIDLDAQANLSLALGVEPEMVKQSIANIMLDSVPLRSICQPTAIERLSLVPANSEMGLAERFLPMRKGYELTILNLLQRDSNAYDIVLLDCPPFLGAVTTGALSAADLLIIPTQPEYFSIYALRNMMTVIRRVRAQNNPRLTYRLLLTMHDRRNRTHRNLTEQLHENFGSGLFDTTIDIDTKLRESPLAGTSVLAHAPKSRAAAQYRALAQEILQHVQKTTAEPTR